MITNYAVHAINATIGEYDVRLTNPGLGATDEYAVMRWAANTPFHSVTSESLTINGWERTISKITISRYVTIEELDKLLS
jgi:hypothetical protein